jgi:hypothetical protein
VGSRAQALLSSPRRRRRLIWLALVVIVGGVTAALIAFDRNSAPSIATPMTKGKPQVPAPQPKNVKFTKREALEVLPVAQRFVFDAVARHNMHAAWDISAPELKADTSRADWDRGENTEVVPYPVDHARWSLDYSYHDAVGLQVAVFPKPKASLGAMVFYIELKRARGGRHSKWLVDQWLPSAGSSYIVHGKRDPNVLNRSTAPPQGLSTIWLVVPAGLLATILLIPVALGLREWRRNRRARRKYEANLPQLSQYGQPR